MSDLPKQKEELAVTTEERQELDDARKISITSNKDCLESTPERALIFKRVIPPSHTTSNMA